MGIIIFKPKMVSPLGLYDVVKQASSYYTGGFTYWINRSNNDYFRYSIYGTKYAVESIKTLKITYDDSILIHMAAKFEIEGCSFLFKQPISVNSYFPFNLPGNINRRVFATDIVIPDSDKRFVEDMKEDYYLRTRRFFNKIIPNEDVLNLISNNKEKEFFNVNKDLISKDTNFIYTDGNTYHIFNESKWMLHKGVYYSRYLNIKKFKSTTSFPAVVQKPEDTEAVQSSYKSSIKSKLKLLKSVKDNYYLRRNFDDGKIRFHIVDINEDTNTVILKPLNADIAHPVHIHLTFLLKSYVFYRRKKLNNLPF